MTTDTPRTYLPAAGFDWTLPLYDPLVKLLGGERARRALIDQADLRPGHAVLEVGCGTGSLLLQIARTHPGAALTGLDPDPKALARARRKLARAPAPVQLDRGFGDALPYPDATFDRVFSCFMFHHLADTDEKVRTLREVRRVLKPGGRLQLLDFTHDAGRHGGLHARIHARHRLADNSDARLIALMQDAGFERPALVKRGRMFVIFGLGYYQASAPQSV